LQTRKIFKNSLKTDLETLNNHKAGFVNIIGNPNTGKSTLMNVLVGERLSIITSKAQTTRHRILGIVSTNEYQIVFSDTPGLLKPKYKLHETMMNTVKVALQDADIFLIVTDITESFEKSIELIPSSVINGNIPVLLLINKIDLSNQSVLEERVQQYHQFIPRAEILPISALHKVNTEYILKRIIELLPYSPPYFEKDQLTDKPERFFVSEIIREKILLLYEEEIPYATEVVVESFKDSDKLLKIAATIYVERESQKPILIGKEGKAIKKLGIESRKDLEAFFGKQVYLELFVKVNPNWRNNEQNLKRFGYLD
jgi:GTP-binding protein Era